MSNYNDRKDDELQHYGVKGMTWDEAKKKGEAEIEQAKKRAKKLKNKIKKSLKKLPPKVKSRLKKLLGKGKKFTKQQLLKAVKAAKKGAGAAERKLEKGVKEGKKTYKKGKKAASKKAKALLKEGTRVSRNKLGITKREARLRAQDQQIRKLDPSYRPPNRTLKGKIAKNRMKLNTTIDKTLAKAKGVPAAAVRTAKNKTGITKRASQKRAESARLGRLNPEMVARENRNLRGKANLVKQLAETRVNVARRKAGEAFNAAPDKAKSAYKQGKKSAASAYKKGKKSVAGAKQGLKNKTGITRREAEKRRDKVMYGKLNPGENRYKKKNRFGRKTKRTVMSWYENPKRY